MYNSIENEQEKFVILVDLENVKKTFETLTIKRIAEGKSEGHQSTHPDFETLRTNFLNEGKIIAARTFFPIPTRLEDFPSFIILLNKLTDLGFLHVVNIFTEKQKEADSTDRNLRDYGTFCIQNINFTTLVIVSDDVDMLPLANEAILDGKKVVFIESMNVNLRIRNNPDITIQRMPLVC